MKKFLVFFALFFVLFLIPSKANALYIDNIAGQNSYSNYIFAINAYNDEPNPPEYIKDTSTILIDIVARDSSGNPAAPFSTNETYAILFESPGYKCQRDYDPKLGWYTDIKKAQNTNKLTFAVWAKSLVCDLVPGTYTIKVWSKSDQKLLFESVSFPIGSTTGGTAVKLAPIANDNNNLICKDRVTEARIENAEKGKTYNVWWDGDKKYFAWSGPAPDRSFSISLEGGDHGREGAEDFKDNTKELLCIIEGDLWLNTPGLRFSGCNKSTALEYTVGDAAKCANNTQKSCSAKPNPLTIGTNKKEAIISGKNFPGEGFPAGITTYRGDLVDTKNTTAEPKRFPNLTPTGNGSLTVNTGEIPPSTYVFNFYPQTGDAEVDSKLVCQASSFIIDEKVESGNATGDPSFRSTQCIDGECSQSAGQYCDPASGRALGKGKTGDGILTAIGCIPTDPGIFVAGLMKYITGFSGGVALLLMVFGSFQMMTSGGNADTLKKGREQFVSAVIGLLFVIFSVLLMQIIGVDILGLPGFSK